MTATLDNAVQGGFTVDVSTLDLTATIADSDYSSVTSQTLTFAGTVGETQTFTITPTADSKLETDETISISQSNLSATSLEVVITDGATVTINNDDAAAVTISDISGNEDDGDMTVTATLDNAVQGGFTVDVSTLDLTATIADSDYSSVTSQTLTFAGTVGETQTFTITPTADSKLETDETISISQSNLSATSLEVVITDGATVTINNDDAAAVTIADISGNEDDGDIAVTVVLDNAVQGGFTVDASILDGTATTADSDYTTVSGQTLTFTGTAGETQTFTITPTVDTKVEADETIIITQGNLSATSLGVVIADGATVTILNDDAATVTIADISGNEDDGVITVTVVLDNAVQGGFTVDASTLDGTATTSDSDYYTVINETLTFTGTSGEVRTFVITLAPDNKLEADETFTVSVANLLSSLPVDITDVATVTINNDDAATVTIADINGNEEDGVIAVTLTLDNEVQGGFTVDVNTADGTATAADSDYEAVSSETLTFTGFAGEIQTFTVLPSADQKVEADETLTISQTNLSATSLGVGISDTSTVTINNDDSATITIADGQGVEADGTITIVATLDNAVQGGFVINATTVDGTAVAATDFTAITNAAAATFTGNAGETQNIVLTITDDIAGEDIESFIVTMTSLGSTSLASDITFTDDATITIKDDDAPVVSAVSAPIAGLYGIGDNLDFTVTFINAATTTGGPSIPVIIGTTTVQASLNGAITNSLTANFRYTVVEDDLDSDGITIGSTINLNGGTILGSTNIPAILDLNNISNSSNVNVEAIRPTAVITSTVANPINSVFTTTFTFSEAVTGFDILDITLTNGTASDFKSTSSFVYTAVITPTVDGSVTVDVASDVANDAATNGNAASNVFSVLYDATNPVPTITSTSPDPTNTAFTVDINFTEDVFGFEIDALVVTNGTPSDFTVISATQYSVLIAPETSEPVFVDILANVTADAASNPNDAATFEIEFDNSLPLPPQITHISDYTCTGDKSMTGDNTLEISGLGIAEQLAYIEVFLDGVSIGTTSSIDVGGFFVFDYTSVTLADGTYSFTVIAVDKASNASALSAPLTITINSLDTDGDGLPDFCDDDVEGNGVDDVDEDCDGDGIIDSMDTDNSACESAIAQTKKYGFSPNGDRINDTWTIQGITAYPNNLVQVFNRSGKQVFEKKAYQNDWDGISNQISNSGNNRLPVGSYLFIVDLADGSKPTRGWLYINY